MFFTFGDGDEAGKILYEPVYVLPRHRPSSDARRTRRPHWRRPGPAPRDLIPTTEPRPGQFCETSVSSTVAASRTDRLEIVTKAIDVAGGAPEAALRRNRPRSGGRPPTAAADRFGQVGDPGEQRWDHRRRTSGRRQRQTMKGQVRAYLDPLRPTPQTEQNPFSRAPQSRTPSPRDLCALRSRTLREHRVE